MAKLPDNFVKAPAETSRVTTAKPQSKPVGKQLRRKAGRGALQPPANAPEHREVGAGDPAEAEGDAPRGFEEVHTGVYTGVHSVLVRLSPEEHQALSAACEALAAIGETVAIEDMIRRVVERWIAATRAAATAEPPAAAPAVPPRAIAAVRAQLRRLAAQPVRRWQALRQALRRWSHALAG
jgi:hypothetical protein